MSYHANVTRPFRLNVSMLKCMSLAPTLSLHLSKIRSTVKSCHKHTERPTQTHEYTLRCMATCYEINQQNVDWCLSTDQLNAICSINVNVKSNIQSICRVLRFFVLPMRVLRMESCRVFAPVGPLLRANKSRLLPTIVTLAPIRASCRLPVRALTGGSEHISQTHRSLMKNGQSQNSFSTDCSDSLNTHLLKFIKRQAATQSHIIKPEQW